MKISEKYIILAKKLKALADGGIGGEKDNAIRMLNTYLKKHNIKPEDIDDERRKDRRYIVPEIWHRLFNQICASINVPTYTPQIRPKQGRIIQCNHGEFIEVDMKFNFYKKEYIKELNVFFKAFIAQNNLYKYVNKEDMPDKTPEEEDEDWRAAIMASAIKRSKFIKQIERKQ